MFSSCIMLYQIYRTSYLYFSIHLHLIWKCKLHQLHVSPQTGNCSSPLFMVYTYYLISLFSYYSVMEIINKVPAQILLLRDNLIRECSKKAGVGGLSEPGSLWPSKFHTHRRRTIQGFDGNQIVFNHLYLHNIQTILSIPSL